MTAMRYNTGMPTLSTATVEVLPVNREMARPLYFLAHRAPGTTRAGQWTLLAGIGRSGEDAAHTSARLVGEQASLIPLSILSVNQVRITYDPLADTINLSAVFVAEVDDCAAVLAPIYDEGRWIRYEAALELLATPDERALLSFINEFVVLAPDRGASHRVLVNG
jgi:hypothetical protein